MTTPAPVIPDWALIAIFVYAALWATFLITGIFFFATGVYYHKRGWENARAQPEKVDVR